MKEWQINEKRNWKGMVFPYDDFFPDDSTECQYCLTEKQAEIIRGIIEPLAWSTRWFSDENDINQDEIQEFRDDIIRRLMMSCCGGEFEVIFQWTEDGVLQQSDDEGETWEDVPQEDPRNSSPVFPPVSGSPSSDKKCIAATGMKELIKEQIGGQLTDDMSRYTLGQLLTDWVKTLIQTSNPFLALITIATNQIFALVIATIRLALTDPVYEQLQCIFLCNMEDDLSFTDEEWETIRSQILDQITGVAGVFLEHLVFLLGKVGLTNLARSQAALEGDCSDCCPSCVGNWGWGVPEWTPTGLVEGDDYIEVDAYPPGNGYWYWPMKTSDSSICCDFIVTGDFDPAATSFCARYPCGVGDANFSTEGSPWINDALAAPHGEGVGVMIRASFPFTARITFS